MISVKEMIRVIIGAMGLASLAQPALADGFFMQTDAGRDMRVRMEGFEEAFEMEAVTQGEHAAWVKHNAMPWSFAPERKSIRAPTA